MDHSTIWKIIDTYFRDNPQCLVNHHTESYNDFFKTGIQKIFKEKNPVRVASKYNEKTREFASECLMYFGGKEGNKIYFGKPVIYDENNSHYMFPNEARLRNMTYGMTIHYDVDIEFIDQLEPGQMPTIIGGEYMKQIEQHDMVGGSGDMTSDKLQKIILESGLVTDANLLETDKDGKVVVKELPKAECGNAKCPSKSLDEDGGGPGDDDFNGDPNKPSFCGGAPKKKKENAKIPFQMTTAVAERLREVTEKSMVSKNVQKREHTLEKVYLGKFPIMLQSDFCVLSGMPREMRYNVGECLNDIGGYFIIDGKEKTVVCQEKFGDNMLYIRKEKPDVYLASAEIRSVSENASKPVRTLSLHLVSPGAKYTNANIVVNIPNVRKPVPLFIVFRALGIISDKDIIERCLLNLERYEPMVDLFIPSVHDAGAILNQQTAITYIGLLTKGKGTIHALEILSDYFLPHVGETNFVQKAYYLGYMVFRLLSAHTGMETFTDRDNFKFKRIELVGTLMYDLFREYYTIQQREIQFEFEKRLYFNANLYEDNLFGLIYENHADVFRQRTVEAGFRKAFKGNWGAKPHTKRVGIVQDLNRLSFNSALNHLRKTNLPMDPTAKVIPPRLLHNSQWGVIDPIDTPDGGNIGLHKHLAISTHITRGMSREPIIQWLREKVAMKFVEECSPRSLSNMTKIIVNGLWIGAVQEPFETIAKIRFYRRNALLPTYMSATFDIQSNTIFMFCDGGRLCRPIFYRDEVTKKASYVEMLEILQEGKFTWLDLITGQNEKRGDVNFDPKNGKVYELYELYEGVGQETNPAKFDRYLKKKAVIDYLDVNESENALISLTVGDFETQSSTTHSEIHESLILGMMCNQIIFPENNPASRNSFSCGQSKQACSLYHTNYQVRMDKTAVLLNHGQVPLVKSRYMNYINHEENPYGENAIVAIMCYSGYNVEDAILINEGALKRGLFRTTYFSTYEAHEEMNKSENGSSIKKFGNIETNEFVVGTKPGCDYTKLDAYGLIKENTPVNDKTILIGQTVSVDGAQKETDASKVPKKGQVGVVDKAFITEGEEGYRIAKVRLREQRIPNLGDKMASRSGQKGTIGMVIPEADMPFTKDGIRPDIIINPHAIPSRMTIGQLVESITGKACAIYGGFGECTAFANEGSKIEVFGQMLTGVGYHSSGNEILYNGMTGEQLEMEIFMGPTYYMRLKHMVKDKVNYRSLGPRSALTKQPVGGRANDGGLRIGEMERDTIISHGMTDFLRESMMERSDKYYFAVCNKTGMLSIYNSAKNLFLSPMADGPVKFTGSLAGNDIRIENVSKYGRDFSVICAPYSFKLMLQELSTMNVQMRLITEDNIGHLESMSYSKNINKLLHLPLTETSKTSIDAVVRDIRMGLGQGQRMPDTPVDNQPKTPVDNEPAYQPDYGSPAYQPDYGSPAYQPDYGSPAYQPDYGSPAYQPDYGSPVYNPNTPTIYDEELEQIYLPHSPTSPPPLQKGGMVYLRHDTKPNRLWKIKNPGENFITIETEDYEGITDPTDTIRVIGNFNDLIDPKTVPHLPVQPQQQVQSYVPPGIQPQAQAPVIINFSPKMVAGNDNSTEAAAAPTHTIPDTFSNEFVTPPVRMDGGNIEPKKQEPEKEATLFDKAMDFSKLVIRKIGS